MLTLLDVPVRAIVAPFLDQHASRLLSDAVRRAVLPLEPAGGVWFQNSGMYHATVWHASHHQVPAERPATLLYQCKPKQHTVHTSRSRTVLN